MEEAPPEVCGICRHAFDYPDQLERHLKVHSSPVPSLERRKGRSFDVKERFPVPSDVRWVAVRCRSCGEEALQAVSEAFGFTLENAPCSGCKRKSYEPREPTDDEKKFLSKPRPGFLQYQLRSAVADMRAKGRRIPVEGPFLPGFA